MMKQTAIVTDLTYRQVENPLKGHPQAPPVLDALIVEAEAHGVTIDIICPNKFGYSYDNPALCVLSALGARPSDLEAGIGKAVSYVYQEDAYFPTDAFINTGRSLLEANMWFNPDIEA